MKEVVISTRHCSGQVRLKFLLKEGPEFTQTLGGVVFTWSRRIRSRLSKRILLSGRIRSQLQGLLHQVRSKELETKLGLLCLKSFARKGQRRW